MASTARATIPTHYPPDVLTQERMANHPHSRSHDDAHCGATKGDSGSSGPVSRPDGGPCIFVVCHHHRSSLVPNTVRPGRRPALPSPSTAPACPAMHPTPTTRTHCQGHCFRPVPSYASPLLPMPSAPPGLSRHLGSLGGLHAATSVGPRKDPTSVGP